MPILNFDQSSPKLREELVKKISTSNRREDLFIEMMRARKQYANDSEKQEIIRELLAPLLNYMSTPDHHPNRYPIVRLMLNADTQDVFFDTLEHFNLPESILKDPEYGTLIHLACDNNDYVLFHHLLNYFNLQDIMKKRHVDQQSALGLAAEQSNTAIVRDLLQKLDDHKINTPESPNAIPVLHSALFKVHDKHSDPYKERQIRTFIMLLERCSLELLERPFNHMTPIDRARQLHYKQGRGNAHLLIIARAYSTGFKIQERISSFLEQEIKQVESMKKNDFFGGLFNFLGHDKRQIKKWLHTFKNNIDRMIYRSEFPEFEDNSFTDQQVLHLLINKIVAYEDHIQPSLNSILNQKCIQRLHEMFISDDEVHHTLNQ